MARPQARRTLPVHKRNTNPEIYKGLFLFICLKTNIPHSLYTP